jgi:hypothetical protein
VREWGKWQGGKKEVIKKYGSAGVRECGSKEKKGIGLQESGFGKKKSMKISSQQTEGYRPQAAGKELKRDQGGSAVIARSREPVERATWQSLIPENDWIASSLRSSQ